MSDRKYYTLQVVKLEDAARRPNNTPSYVQVTIDKTVHKTGPIDGEGKSSWASTVTFSDLDTDANFNIRLKQFRKGARDREVGSIDVSAQELLDKDDVRLKLTPATAGAVHIRLKTVDAFGRAEAELANAEQSVGQIRTLGSEFTVGTIGSVISALDGLVTAVDAVAELHSLFDVSWKATSALYKLVSRQFKTDAQLQEMVKSMTDACNFSEKARNVKDRTEELNVIIKELLNETVECCQLVRKYASRSFFGRMARWQWSQTIGDYTGRFNDLRERLDKVITLTIASGVDAVEARLASRELLEALIDPSRMDASVFRISKRARCLSGTRKEYLDNISTRLLSDKECNTVWLTGAAGSGKSTIALTILDRCDEMKLPPAYLFFERGKDDCDSVIRAIAYRLAALHETIRPHIVEAVAKNPNINGKSLKVQFEKLLLEPLRIVADQLKHNVFIILDALDESGTDRQREEFLRLLKTDFGKLPPKIRLLITSRPENDIMAILSSAKHIHQLRLEHESDSSRTDVSRFIREEMVKAVDGRAPKNWAWDDAFRVLSDAADGLFIWASTAVKMVQGSHKPRQKLGNLLDNIESVGGGIDNLYSTVLEQSGIQWQDDSEGEVARILGVILFAKEAMSGADIEAFLGLEEDTVDSVLSHFRSVLSYEAGQPVRIHHASFADYLIERCRGKPWNVDEADLKKTITERCFDVMKQELRFNICDFPSSFIKNDDVPELAEKVKNRIRPHLDYACRFWSVHLCELADAALPLDKVDTFAHKHLLYWLEVLSLKKYFNRVAGSALRDACVRVASIHTEISSFLWATYRLVVIFADPISQSAPHIYLSAISLWKGESRVADHYSTAHPIVRVQRFGKKMPATCMKVLEGHTSWVMSVVFSPDGKRIASGSDDGTIRIWDADSGELVSAPFEGHTGYVLSVAFSPDGKRIVSGSWDKTVRVWDVNSGQLISGPFDGHTNSVNMVAFAPDGGRIVSGSDDGTIRIWDSVTGKLVCGPLEGHTGRVWSVAFSPDGKHIASGSGDKTVRVWDADSGQPISGAFEGHTDEVNSVVFSPDGERVVSGSDDKTIRIWDVDSGQQLLGFEGHRERVLSVAFSHDGKSIASGSADCTICLRDANSGDLVSGPFNGHTSVVKSVAFSPDGKRVVSGSWDRTIRIWDADSGKIDSGSFEGHTGWIYSVAFHPDGRRVVSGSYDGTICIWDVVTGQLVSGPLKGHTAPVYSVAISLDGRRIASGSGDNTVRVWDTGTGNFVCGPLEGHTKAVRSAAFSPDGKRIVTGSGDGTIRVWDAVSGKLVLGPLEGHTNIVWSVAFSMDGKRVASASRDKTVRIWDADTGELVSGPLEGHTDEVNSVAFSPDDRHVVSGSDDKSIRIWNADTGKLILGPFEGHTDWVRSVAFSPDGKRIVSGSYDKTIRVWDVDTGELLSGPFKGHTSSVLSVAFSPDGKYVVSGSSDSTVRVWKISDDEDSTVLSDTPTTSSECALTARNQVTRVMDKQRLVSGWKLTKNGWVLGTGGELLAWIPEDMRGTLWQSRNTAVLNAQFFTKLAFDKSPLGEDWCKGFPKSSWC